MWSCSDIFALFNGSVLGAIIVVVVLVTTALHPSNTRRVFKRTTQPAAALTRKQTTLELKDLRLIPSTIGNSPHSPTQHSFGFVDQSYSQIKVVVHALLKRKFPIKRLLNNSFIPHGVSDAGIFSVTHLMSQDAPPSQAHP